MIEFNGYLTGSAEHHFRKRSRVLGSKILVCSGLMIFPFIIFLAKFTGNWIIIGVYSALLVTLPLTLQIPNTKKERLALTPKHIYIEKSHIVCIADKYEEIRKIKDVKKIYEYDEFYEIIFSFGKVSEKFICQKSLLTKGSIKSFEMLFEGKILKRQHRGSTGGTGDGFA